MANRVPARLTPRQGRRFALPVGLAMALLASIMWWRGRDVAATGLSALAGAFLLAGVLIPSRLAPVFRAWMGLAKMISRVTTPVFMGLVYFLAIVPTGLVMRLAGRNPVRRTEVDGSFWVRREGRRPPESMTHQF